MNRTRPTTRFKIILFLSLVITAAQHSQSFANDSAADSFVLYKKAKSGLFFYDKTKDFSLYNKVFLYPVNYENAKISDETKHKYRKSWATFDKDSWRSLAERFEALAENTFSQSKYFSLVTSAEDSEIVLEFRFKDFTPITENSDGYIGTTGDTQKLLGLGSMVFQVVIVDSRTHELLAVVESRYPIRTGKFSARDSRVSRNLAWNRSFKMLIDNLLLDMTKQKKDEAKD